MTPKTKAKLIRKGNRIGKTASQMNLESTGLKPRRSIPVKEVNEMIDRAVSHVKAEQTIYDDRNKLIVEIAEQERAVEYHENCLHMIERSLIQLRLQLKQTNTAIARELDLDSLS